MRKKHSLEFKTGQNEIYDKERKKCNKYQTIGKRQFEEKIKYYTI